MDQVEILREVRKELAEVRRLLERGSAGAALVARWPLVLSFEEAAERLGVSVRTMRRMVKCGDVLTVEIHGTRKVPVSELERLIVPPAEVSAAASSAPPRKKPRRPSTEADAIRAVTRPRAARR